MSWLILLSYQTSFTMRGATGITFQPHQILRLPRKMNLMIDPHHIWHVIYNARSNRHHLPTSPNTAPATQNDHPTSDRNWLKTGETSFPMRDRSENDPTTIRAWSDPENANRNPPRHRGYFSHSSGADSIENFNVSRSGYHSKFHHMLRLPRKVTHELHQMLRLPRKMNLMIDPHHILWNVIYNARSNRHHPPTSPNTAPATQNESHDWFTSHMTRHLQCAEQQASPSNLTKYCACHAKWPPNISKKLAENRWNVISNARPIREWSDHDPSMIRPRKRKPQPAAPQRLLFALARSRFYWKLQRFPLRLSFQISPHAAPATKSDTWTSPNAAPATKSDTWTSPNAAPATKSYC